jgi:hypothetical protein
MNPIPGDIQQHQASIKAASRNIEMTLPSESKQLSRY